MNRRQFLAGATVLTVLAPSIPTSALDVDLIESPIMWMLRMLPDRPGPDGLDFPVTTAANHLIRREVWPENPDMAWDPVGEDYLTIFGYHPSAASLSAGYEGTSLLTLNNLVYDWENTRDQLQANGWKMVNEEFQLLHYAGSREDRDELAGSLHELGSLMRAGNWDWISLTDVAHLVSGPDEELVLTIADRVKNYPVMTVILTNFHGLTYVLLPETYYMALIPAQVLPVKKSRAAFVAKSWSGDTPIVQSVGLRLESEDDLEPMLQTIRERLATEVSPVNGEPYGSFLEIVDSASYHASLRVDFVVTTGDWDIAYAIEMDDLHMLPLTTMGG